MRGDEDESTKIRVGVPLKEPERANLYDWSFSYESMMPLAPNEWPFVMLRSMLNRKGLIWITSLGETIAETKELEKFATIYGLKGRIYMEEGKEFEFDEQDDIQKRLVVIKSVYGRTQITPVLIFIFLNVPF